MGSVQRVFIVSSLALASAIGAVSVLAKNGRRADVNSFGEFRSADTPILKEHGYKPIKLLETRHAALIMTKER